MIQIKGYGARGSQDTQMIVRLARYRYAGATALLLGLVLAAGRLGPLAAQRDVSEAIHEVLSDPSEYAGVDVTLLGQMQELYAMRGYRPIWHRSSEADARARLAIDVLQHADEQGLEVADYAVGPLDRPDSIEQIAQADAALTGAVLTYARDVSMGRLSTSTVYGDTGFPASSFDTVKGLMAAIQHDTLPAFLAQLPPPHAEYRSLVRALAQYRSLANAGGWPNLPRGKELKIGSDDPRLDILKRRLAAEDPGKQLTIETDHALISALKDVQLRHGLDPDGRIGARTLEMLNIPVSERISQIIANMERWRWMPREFERRYIAVNAAEQTLRYFVEGMEVLSSRVIVGRPQSPTPIFRATATAVTANPPWNVPRKIAAREILPKLKQNPNYLATQDMVLVNGPPNDPQGVREDWRRWTAANFPYRIRQLPGEKNALGVLKLEMPNRFDVYLHDTPGKAAFARDDRALSHGCIRVQQILPLAELALGGDYGDAARKLGPAIASGTTQQLTLGEPLPVYVLYWTVVADADGSVGFRRDIYGRDRQLIAALNNKAHMAPLAMRRSIVTSCSAEM